MQYGNNRRRLTGIVGKRLRPDQIFLRFLCKL